MFQVASGQGGRGGGGDREEKENSTEFKNTEKAERHSVNFLPVATTMDRCEELIRCFKSKVRIFGLNSSVIAEGLDAAREVNEVACSPASFTSGEKLKVLQDALAIVERTCQFSATVGATAERSGAALACLRNNVACLQVGSADNDLAQVDSLFDCESAPLATRTILLLNRCTFFLQWLCLDASARSQAFAVGTALDHARAAVRVLERFRVGGEGGEFFLGFLGRGGREGSMPYATNR